MTIVQTVLTQIQMRSLSLLGLLLIAIWSLSPLGSQASLRIIRTARQSNFTTQPLQYVNTSYDLMSMSVGSDDTDSTFTPMNVLFGAAMMGLSSSASQHVDNWNNMKIPWIENLDPSTADTDGWYPIPQFNSSDNFTSLIGIPLSEITLASNLTTTFTIETSYWTLSCPVFENLGNGSNATGQWDDASRAKLEADIGRFVDPGYQSQQNTSSFDPQNMYLYSQEFLHNNSESWDSPANARLRHITYLDNNNGPGYTSNPTHWVAANCTIKTRHVEVSASCASGSCTAVGIRNSQKPHAPESYTSFDLRGSDDFYWFGLHFIKALVVGELDTATPYQKFILNPLNPFDDVNIKPPLTDGVSNATFAIRLGQLLNTYWIAMFAPSAIPKGLRNTNITGDVAHWTESERSPLLTANVTETRDFPVLRCDPLWLVVLLLSSAVTALIGLCGLIAALCRLGPDIGFNISSLVKDSPFVDQTSVATTLGSTDRSILMRDWYAKFGDVAAEEEVGHIAIGSGNVGDLQRGRLYR
jgi:hypothetical protein